MNCYDLKLNSWTSITSYFLAQFVNQCLQTNWPKLAQKELDSPKKIEQSILASSIVRDNGDIGRQSGIRLRTAQKWNIITFSIFSRVF